MVYSLDGADGFTSTDSGLGTIDNLNGLPTNNSAPTHQILELGTTSNLNGLFTFNLLNLQPKWFTHLQPAIAKTHTIPQQNKTKRIF